MGDRVVCSDLDGVISYTSEDRKKYRPNLSGYYAGSMLGIVPKNLQIIVSSRKAQYKKITERWLSDMGVDYDFLYLMENGIKKNRSTVIDYKINTLEYLLEKYRNLVYYEDDFAVASAIKNNLPEIEVVNISVLPIKTKKQKKVVVE